ncbi:hypothetical protein [Serratia quinivorans]|uniref:hypothetical protein n=1 Tax=Serratia quinivorans TaxID=137545 RepID=UPI00217A78B5|nr:hypothetical protein [Serratia quinivorans]CAI0732677.1 Uncharacterised protein [Serratia quinivorans]CAI1606621.1 Uncharacterised protein [Serratia quinivorans]
MMIDRQVKAHLEQIKIQQNDQKAASQLLIQHILKILETKPGCENISDEIATSLKKSKLLSMQKEHVDAAIDLMKL